MWICTARFRETVTRLMRSCLLRLAEMLFQFPTKHSDSNDGSLNKSDSEFETVGLATDTPRCKSAAMKPRNIQFAAAGQTEMLATGIFGDCHAADGEVLELGSEDTDEQSRLARTAPAVTLWNRQPVQIITQEPRKTTFVFLGSCDQTRSGVLNPLQLVCYTLWRRRQDQDIRL